MARDYAKTEDEMNLTTNAKLSDSHCHFDFTLFDKTRDTHWHLAQKLGIQRLLIPGVHYQQSARLAAFCQHKPWFFAYGLHPCFLDQHQMQHLSQLEQLSKHSKPLAIGECGLDFRTANDEQKHQQWQYFEGQIDLAAQLKLPLILHAVKTHQQIISCLKRKQFTHGGIIHGFAGSLEQAKDYLALNFKLGIGGLLGKHNNVRLKQIIQALPTSAFLLETDAPDMPADFAQKHSSPAFIALYAQMLAHLKQLHLEQLSEVLEASWQTLFHSHEHPQ